MSRFAAALTTLCLAASLWAQAGGLLEQADAAFRNGDLERAATLARRVVAADPNAVPAYMILGVIAAQRNQWDASSKHFQTVIRLAPSDPYGYFYLGQAKLYQQQWEPAVQYFAKALERHYPDRERLTIEMAFAQDEAGHPQAALESLAKVRAPAAGPLAAQYHAVTAFAQSRLNQPTAAIEAIRRALHVEDSNPQYWEFLITSLMNTDQTPRALAEAIRAQRRFPDHPDVQFLFGLASYYVTESPLIGLALRNLREVEPEGARVLLVQGLSYRKQGKVEDATKALTEAAKRGVPDAHLLLGILLKESGDYTGAEREYREAERLNPGNGQALLELGKMLLGKGALQEAVRRLEKAEQYMPANAAVHYQLGLAYGRLGEKEKADKHLMLNQRLQKEQAELAR